MSKTIEIQLRPFDYYFFGGEETFNSGAKGEVNYHVKSNLLPQQTGLLGLMRHALLTAGYSIGESFNGLNTGFDDLISLSPLFLTNKEGHRLLPAPACINQEQRNLALSFAGTASAYINGQWQDYAVEAPGYKAKEGLAHGWLNVQSGAFVSNDEVFAAKDHIGINKYKRITEQTDEGAFYKQQFISLKDGYAFGFYTVVNDTIDIANLPVVLNFGGERRSFHINYKPADKNAWDNLIAEASRHYNIHANDQPCIMLLSDTYIGSMESLNDLLLFALMEEQPFRNIITPKSADNFGSFTRDPVADTSKLHKEKNIRWMLKKGSVLYYNQEYRGKVEALLFHEGFKNIGYNHYLIY